MNEHNQMEQVRRAVDTRLSGLEGDPWMAQRVLTNAKGTKKVKKKVSVGFVLMMVLLIAIAAAVAVTTLTDYFSGYAELEDTYGSYTDTWPTDAKVELIQLMADNGLNIDRENTEELLGGIFGEKQQATLADDILSAYFNGLESTDTFNIMQNELGMMDGWTYEQLALYTSLLDEYGQFQEDWTRFLLPGECDISEKDAIILAKETLMSTYAVTNNTLDEYTIVTMFLQTAEYGDVPVWVIEFRERVDSAAVYTAIITGSGDVYSINAFGHMPIVSGEAPLADAIPAQLHDYDENPGQILINARSVLTENMDYTADEADQYTTSAEFLYSDRYCAGMEPVWIVTLSLDGTPAYKVLLGYDGQFIDVVEAGKEFSNVQRNGEKLGYDDDTTLFNTQGQYFYDWPIEEKAAFSAKWIPAVELFMERNPYFTGEGNHVWTWTRRAYGLPDNTSITQNEALSIAQDAARQLGASNELIQVLGRACCFFDITNMQQPLWLVILLQDTAMDTVMEDSIHRYFITIDAANRAVLDAYEDHSTNSIADFLSTPYQVNDTENPEADDAASETVLTDRTPAQLFDYDATMEEAVAAAREALIAYAGLAKETVEQYTADPEFFYSGWYCLGEEPVWHITFSVGDTEVLKVLLGYDASFIDWAPSGEEFTKLVREGDELGHYSYLNNQEGAGFYDWSLAEKAAFSETWIPLAEDYKASHPYFTGDRNNFWQWTRRAFGMPSGTDIQQDEALAIAKETLKQYGETDETLRQIDGVQYFFDATKPGPPQWRIRIYWNADLQHGNMAKEHHYFIKLNAETGEVIDTLVCPYGFDSNEVMSAFISQP
jgi:hypothetical protein